MVQHFALKHEASICPYLLKNFLRELLAIHPFGIFIILNVYEAKSSLRDSFQYIKAYGSL